jgi:hypothetical protein
MAHRIYCGLPFRLKLETRNWKLEIQFKGKDSFASVPFALRRAPVFHMFVSSDKPNADVLR